MRHKLFLGFFLLLFVISCVGQQVATGVQTPKQKAAFFMSVYNAQYNDYLLASTQPNLTDEQKSVLVNKKKVLTEVYDPIKLYDFYAVQGQIPPTTLEILITQKLNELGAKLTK